MLMDSPNSDNLYYYYNRIVIIGQSVYLNKIMAMNTACTTNPTPIVTVFKLSLSTTARANSKTKPAQVNSTMSRFGVRSLSPVISANKVGIVAQCRTTAANHCRVSAEILGSCAESQTDVDFKMLSSFTIIFCFLSKRCVDQSWPHGVCPIGG